MFKQAIYLALILCLSGCAKYGSAPFSDTELARQAFCTIVTIVDWRQTLNIKNKPGLHENNIILGRNPSDSKINTLLPLAIAAQWLIAWRLEPKYRRKWQFVTGGTESAAVAWNINKGLSL